MGCAARTQQPLSDELYMKLFVCKSWESVNSHWILTRVDTKQFFHTHYDIRSAMPQAMKTRTRCKDEAKMHMNAVIIKSIKLHLQNLIKKKERKIIWWFLPLNKWLKFWRNFCILCAKTPINICSHSDRSCFDWTVTITWFSQSQRWEGS